jgi:hypothetical protein
MREYESEVMFSLHEAFSLQIRSSLLKWETELLDNIKGYK